TGASARRGVAKTDRVAQNRSSALRRGGRPWLRLETRDAGSVAGRAGGRGVADQMVNVVFEFGAPHLEFLDFLVGGEVNFLFDAIDGVVEAVIFIEHFPE